MPFGIGSAVDSATSIAWAKVQKGRQRALFEELANGKYELTEDLVTNDDFLHCFVLVARAAERTRQHEKIRMLTRLLRAGVEEQGSYLDVDEFEEFLLILEEMTWREMNLLTLLRSISIEHPRDEITQNVLEWTTSFWGTFQTQAEDELGVAPDQLEGVLTRLSRTGCVQELSGGYLGYGGGAFVVTPLFERLADRVLPGQG